MSNKSSTSSDCAARRGSPPKCVDEVLGTSADSLEGREADEVAEGAISEGGSDEFASKAEMFEDGGRGETFSSQSMMSISVEGS